MIYKDCIYKLKKLCGFFFKLYKHWINIILLCISYIIGFFKKIQIKKDFRKKMKLKFEGFKRDINEYKEDIEKLVCNMVLLQDYDLLEMNNRLIEQTEIPKFLEMLTEINFTAGLLRTNKNISKSSIFYERKRDFGNKRRIDLEVLIDSKVYLIQVKSSSKGKRKKMQDNIIRNIQKKAVDLPIRKFVSISLSSGFSDKDGLFEFIKTKASLNVDNVKYGFSGEKDSKAMVEFYSPTNVTLEHLTLGDYSDLDVMDVTGETTSKLRGALENAVGAFNIETNSEVINLVAMEFPCGEEIDFCDALFGTEFFVGDSLGNDRRSRNTDGFFNDENFKSKISVVIGLIKKDKYSLVSEYWHVFLVNPVFKDETINILKLIPEMKIIYHDTFIEKNFSFEKQKG